MMWKMSLVFAELPIFEAFIKPKTLSTQAEMPSSPPPNAVMISDPLAASKYPISEF